MANDGIKITDLRTEVQTLVNSDLTKYDPNKNGQIDEGDELSQLLSEYQCKREDLTSESGEKMWTLAEQQEINAKVSEKTDDLKLVTDMFFGLGGVTSGAIVGSILGAKGVYDVTENVKTQKIVDIEKLVKDGSYTEGARPAYDIGNKMKHYISEDAARRIQADLPRTGFRRNIVDLVDCPNGRYFTRDIQGKPFILRDWKPGDPQFVKQGTQIVEEFKPVTKKVYNKKVIAKGGLVGLGIALASILGTIAFNKFVDNSYANDAKLDIKARQTADGEKVMAQRRKEQEELRQRQAAMKQAELEYKERLDKATSGIEKQVQMADKKAKSVNRELNAIQKSMEKNSEKNDSTSV